MRQVWTESKAEALTLEISQGGVMPTVSQMRARHPLGNALSCRITRLGGMDEMADRLGLDRAQHSSRRGWEWEEWVAGEARMRGLDVQESERVKSPWDLLINGVRVDVKMANPTFHSNSNQWTWRICSKSRAVDVYVFVAVDDVGPPVVFILPEHVVPMTCATARKSSVDGRFGRYDEWINRWDLLGVRT